MPLWRLWDGDRLIEVTIDQGVIILFCDQCDGDTHPA
jgi:hypothetical protein